MDTWFVTITGIPQFSDKYFIVAACLDKRSCLFTPSVWSKSLRTTEAIESNITNFTSFSITKSSRDSNLVIRRGHKKGIHIVGRANKEWMVVQYLSSRIWNIYLSTRLRELVRLYTITREDNKSKWCGSLKYSGSFALANSINLNRAKMDRDRNNINELGSDIMYHLVTTRYWEGGE